MTKEPDEVDPGDAKPGLLWKELRTLIEALQDLHLQISSRLLEKRVQPPERSTGAEPGLDVSQALKHYIDTNVGAEAGGSSVGRRPTEESSDNVAEEALEDSPSATDAPPETLLDPNELSSHLKEHAIGDEVGRHMGEKMRATTLAHLNRAVQLAKLGDRKGAYMHAEMAENAMRLAREYMPAQEFETFQKELQERMTAVKSETLES